MSLNDQGQESKLILKYDINQVLHDEIVLTSSDFLVNYAVTNICSVLLYMWLPIVKMFVRKF